MAAAAVEGIEAELAVDQPVTRDDAVARHDLVLHPEIDAAMRDQLVDLLEGAGIEQQLDPLARRQLARIVMALETLGAAAQLGAAFEVRQGVQRIRHG